MSLSYLYRRANREIIVGVGPALGALVAAGFYKFIKILEYESANPDQDVDETAMTAELRMTNSEQISAGRPSLSRSKVRTPGDADLESGKMESEADINGHSLRIVSPGTHPMARDLISPTISPTRPL